MPYSDDQLGYIWANRQPRRQAMRAGEVVGRLLAKPGVRFRPRPTALSVTVSELLPRHLTGQVRVGAVACGCLTLLCADGATRQNLRLEEAHLLSSLQQVLGGAAPRRLRLVVPQAGW